MSLYVDSSAFVKLYVDEEHAMYVRAALAADPIWIAARHTAIEVRRALARFAPSAERDRITARFGAHWQRTRIQELDEAVCDLAAEMAETTGVRTLDALHLAAAQLAGGKDLPVLTCDRRMADAARRLGMTVIGASH